MNLESYSFDHIAINNKVTACDMRSTGLPDEAHRYCNIFVIIDGKELGCICFRIPIKGILYQCFLIRRSYLY
jgi:hypothetical protein